MSKLQEMFAAIALEVLLIVRGRYNSNCAQGAESAVYSCIGVIFITLKQWRNG